MNAKRALELSAQALSFLADRPQELQKFLSTTGLDADELLSRSTSKAILTAALSHLAASESLAKDFSLEHNLKPGDLLYACVAIDPHGSSSW